MESALSTTDGPSKAGGRRFAGLRLHPFLYDVLTTGLTQAATLAANFILVGAVSRKMGVMVLGEYLLVKRVSAWLLSGSQLGLGIALPRQIAHSEGDAETRAKQYFLSAFTVAVVFVTSLGSIVALNAERVARWCLGSDNRALVYAMVLLLFGTAAQSMVFGYFRGLERVQAANLVSFSASFLVPLVALGLTYNFHSASLLIGVTGLGLAVASLLWAMPKIAADRDFRHHFVRDAHQLLSYGVGRVPGDIAFGGLLSLGPVLASHYANMAQDSYLLLGITCLTMTGLAFAPAGMVLLARISRLLGTGRHEDVKVYVGHLHSAVLQISLLLAVQGIVFARPIVLWWLGPSCLPGVTVIQMVIVAVPAYMYFVALRSVVDAASSVAHNAHNVLIALAVLVALLAAIIHFVPREWMVIAVAAGNTVAIFVLALATHQTLRALKLAGRPSQFSPLWVAALLGATSLAAQWAFHFQITKPAFCVVLLANLGLTFVTLRKAQPEWMGFVLRVAFTRA